MAGLGLFSRAYAEDGYDLWLRYVPVKGRLLERYRSNATEVVIEAASPTTNGTSCSEGSRACSAARRPCPERQRGVLARAAGEPAKQAYSEFAPPDGRLRPNVQLQVKNSLIDFQPREPFHPLFGAMPRTSLMLDPRAVGVRNHGSVPIPDKPPLSAVAPGAPARDILRAHA